MSQTPASPSSGKEYVLGTGPEELERLGLQHRLWSDAATGAWRRAHLQRGQRVLDIGCGPGYATLELAQLVGHAGEVVGVDESAGYVEYLNGQSGARGLGQARGVVGDVQKLPQALGGASGFDLAYARWVLCFVPDPGAVVAGVAASLRRGGRFCVHDYFNYGAMTMAPRRAAHDRAVAATITSWHARGGDTDIMGKLPGLLEKHGMRVVHLEVHQRLARGHETMFQWPYVWWHTYTPKLVQMGYLTQADQDELFRDLEESKRSATDFFLMPPVFEIIAERA
jgi:ubiquinone/menaquinone biosynthesis C-methylase UbiE